MKTKKTLLLQFTAGFLSVFGLSGPTDFFPKKSDATKDLENMRKDWNNVGGDISKSYGKYKSKYC
jgi:hypothetical protein